MFVFLRVSGQSGLVNHSFFLAHSIMASSSNPVPPQAPPSGSQEKLFDECICSELQKRGGKTTASTRGEHTEHCTGNERISTHASLPISNDSQISGEISGNCIFLELADFQRNFRKPRSGPSRESTVSQCLRKTLRSSFGLYRHFVRLRAARTGNCTTPI